MKAHDSILWTRKYDGFRSDLGGNYLVSSSAWSSRDVVVTGALVKGNFHSPNPWSYTISHTERKPCRGSKIEEVRWTDGWNFEKRQPNWVIGSQEWWTQNYSSAELINTTSESLKLKGIADQAAYDKLIERIRGSLDLSIDLFESRKTIEMVNLSGRLSQAILNVPKERLKVSWHSPLRSLGSKWLEWQYGWRPLISSLYGLTEELTRYEINKVKTVTGSARSAVQRTVPSVFYGLNGVHPATVKLSLEEKCRYVVRLMISPDTGFDTLRRCTSLNPASIAWELLPYSFVVDWFFDIGSYLRGLETAVLYERNFLSGYKSTISVVHQVATGYWSETQASPRGSMYDNCPGHSEYSLSFNRTLLGSFPYPKLPTLKLDLGSERLLSAASLLAQKLKR